MTLHHHAHSSNHINHQSIVCYYHSNINVSLLNPNICTHIIYTSIGIDSDGNIIFPFIEDMQVFSELSFLEKMRKTNEKLKILISIGDKGENQRRNFQSMLSTSHSRKNFARSIVTFCKKINFDGIDLSWQKPNKQYSKAFTDLVKKIKELMHGVFSFHTKMPIAFEVFKFEDKTDPQILTVTLNASACNAYDIKSICKKVKFINLMNFDMHAPAEESLTIDYALSTWMDRGAQLSKINLGIATYEGCNDKRSIEDKASYACYGGLHGIAIHAFDGDDYTNGFPLIRAARDIFERDK
ncbi:hypothetical protein PVAND_014805 [Polypedilum vanderplanki]|uniref:GH18 domain-containing protein n=1 Tax=Polypedilum vanderplanki TaxID=319348 RepID=A0A9J6BB95_POLVA|nr:hypothetical protein PVAND_014805 [Polypedilum vanderplanki]